MSGWVYVQSERAGSCGGERWDDLWTVGHYDPSGKWHPDSDHATKEEAAARVSYLNGGGLTSIKPTEAIE